MTRKSVRRVWGILFIMIVAGVLAGCKKKEEPAPPVIDEPATAKLTVTKVRPAEGHAGQSVRISISGTGFKEGARVLVGDNVLSDVSVPFADNIRANIDAGLEVGSYDVTVRNPDGSEAKLPQGFAILEAIPEGPSPSDCELANVYFDFDVWSLSSDSRNILQRNAECIKARQARRIEVYGHTDERGSTDYNLALGQRRADEVRRYLNQLGFTNIKTISFGEERPADPGSYESAWTKNRRAETKIIE